MKKVISCLLLAIFAGCGQNAVSEYDVMQDALADQRHNQYTKVMADNRKLARKAETKHTPVQVVSPPVISRPIRPVSLPTKLAEKPAEKKADPDFEKALAANAAAITNLIKAVEGLKKTEKDKPKEEKESETPAPHYSKKAAVDKFASYCQGLKDGSEHWTMQYLSIDEPSRVNRIPPGIWRYGQWRFEYRPVERGVYTIYYYDIFSEI